MTLQPPYTYLARVHHWVDGDTVDLDIDLGFKINTRQRCRLWGVDTPERGDPKYIEARDFAASLAPVGTVVLIDSDPPLDKYGRYLVTIILPDESKLNPTLIAAGYARPYFGGKR